MCVYTASALDRYHGPNVKVSFGTGPAHCTADLPLFVEACSLLSRTLLAASLFFLILVVITISCQNPMAVNPAGPRR